MKRNQGWLIKKLREAISIKSYDLLPAFRHESCLLKESLGPPEDRPCITAAKIYGHEPPTHLPKVPMAIYSGKMSRLFKDCQTLDLSGSIPWSLVNIRAGGSQVISGGLAQVWLRVDPHSGHFPSLKYKWNGYPLQFGEPWHWSSLTCGVPWHLAFPSWGKSNGIP